LTVRTHHVAPSDVPRSLEVRNLAGSTTVVADPAATEIVLEVEALNSVAEELVDRLDLVVTERHLRLSVPERRLLRTPSFAITVTTPPDVAVTVAGGSADTALRGRLGSVTLTSSSGDLDVEQCTELQARSASGEVRVGSVAGRATVGTASGDIQVIAADGPVQARTASGDVVLREIATDATVQTASGDVRIDRARSGTLRLTTVSGDASVGVEPGLRIWLDVQTVSGRLRSELDDDEPGEQRGSAQLTAVLKSVSGDVRLRRAAPRPPAPPVPPAPPTVPSPPPPPSAVSR
jgi:Putative adhesin